VTNPPLIVDDHRLVVLRYRRRNARRQVERHRIPAKSLAGFQAKVRVAAWWHGGEIDIDNFDGHADQALAWIVRELGQIEVA
jgi:hypothetical protein